MFLDSGFKTRLKLAMEARDPSVNQSELARHLKVTPQAVQQWVSGRTLPRRDKLVLAADFLYVRFEWIAFGRGPMRASDLERKTSQASSASTEDSLRATEWERALLDSLPPGGNQCWRQEIRHPFGHGQIKTDWFSDSIAANLMLYRNTATLTSGARQHLWVLAVLREAMPPLPNRRTILLLSPFEEWREEPTRHMDVLRAEARLLGLEVLHINTPLQAAAILLGKEARQLVPIADDLGLNPGMFI